MPKKLTPYILNKGLYIMTLGKSQLDDDDEEESELPYNVSSIIPSGEEVETKPVVDQKKWWRNMEETARAFREKGYDVNLYNESVLGGNTRLCENFGAKNFFARLDLSKGEVEERIITMHRRKALEYYKDSKGRSREKSRIKEFLTYNIELRGLDWLENPIWCTLHHEGEAQDVESRIQITTDGNGRQTAQYVFNKLRPKFFIEFSKSAVDSLIKKTGSDKHAIKYYGFIPSDQYSTSIKFKADGYSYEQFLLPWDEFEALAKRNGGPEGVSKWRDVAPKREFIA